MVKIKYIEAIGIAIIIFQLILLSAALSVDPVMGQEEFGYLLAANLILTATLLYMYYKEPDIFPDKALELDEEWVALGIAFTIFILLFIYIK